MFPSFIEFSILYRISLEAEKGSCPRRCDTGELFFDLNLCFSAASAAETPRWEVERSQRQRLQAMHPLARSHPLV
eukprot:s775_g11.t1